jgi:uncharacterized membrane protein YdjX (TVP38/TMEM64 family)
MRSVKESVLVMVESNMSDGSDEGKERSGKPLLMRLFPLAVLAAGFAGFFALGLDSYVNFETLRENRLALTNWVEEAGWIAGLVFLIAYALVVAFSLPAAGVMTIAGGFLFGTLVATSYVVVGATFGASALFLAARSALGDSLKKRLGPGFARIQDGFNEDAFSYMLFLRLVPAFPFFVVNLAPAFMGIKLRTYFVTTLIGIIPGTFVFASIGNGLGSLFDAGETPDLSVLTKPEIIIPILGLALLALIPILHRLVKRRRAAQKDQEMEQD